MTTHKLQQRRRLSIASLALALVGIVFGVAAYLLITHAGITPLLLIPSVVAATVGFTHLFKKEAPRQ